MKIKFADIQTSKQIQGGVPVFRGTRVPVQILIDYIESGETVNDFLFDFPSVSRKQVINVLEYVKNKVFA